MYLMWEREGRNLSQITQMSIIQSKKKSCPEDKRQQNMSNLEKKGVSYKLSALNQLLMYSSACAPVELKNLNPDNYM